MVDVVSQHSGQHSPKAQPSNEFQVVNHNAWAGTPDSIDYSEFYPFNSESDYHSYCSIDYNNETSVEDCWLGDNIVPLIDLRTESSYVAEGYQTWIEQLVSNYSSE